MELIPDRQISDSTKFGDSASQNPSVVPNRIKFPKFKTTDGKEFQIDVPEEQLQMIIDKAQLMSPLIAISSTDPNIDSIMSLLQPGGSPIVFTWLLVVGKIPLTGPYPLTLLLNKTISPQEVGSAHIDMVDRYKRLFLLTTIDRIYLAGEMKITPPSAPGQKTLIECNFASGTYMLYKLKLNQDKLTVSLVNIKTNFINF